MESLAHRAAETSRAWAGGVPIERKSDGSPVTEADRQIQKLIVDAVAQHYPEHAFIGEERIEHNHSLPQPGDVRYCWVADPIDGTRNFTRQLPFVATSIALLDGHSPMVALTHEHNSGWTCSAIAGHGVLCNGRPVEVAARPPGQDTFIAIPSGRHRPILPVVTRWIDRYILRNVGSTCLHMAYLASGCVDAVYCHECKIWDVAAGFLMITEAGGRCADLNGSPLVLDPRGDQERNVPFFAATPMVYDSLLAVLRPADHPPPPAIR